jgi:hypothetical protein
MLQAERDVVEAMTQCKKPDMGGLQQLIMPVGEAIQAADKLTQVCPSELLELGHAVMNQH